MVLLRCRGEGRVVFFSFHTRSTSKYLGITFVIYPGAQKIENAAMAVGS